MTAERKKYFETLYRPKLDLIQEELLDRFILKFLPSTGEKRKYGFNSLYNIHRTLDKIFLNHTGYGISERDVIDAFLRMQYGFRTQVEPWSDLRIKSKIGFYEHVYNENEKIRKKFPGGIKEHEINISVSANDVKLLYYSQNRLPITNGNEEKTIQPRIKMKQDIKLFFGLSSFLEVEDFVPKYILKKIKDNESTSNNL